MPSHLFTPLTLAGLTLPNRIVVSPMSQNRCVDGVIQPWHTMHLGQFAVSGAGLLMVEVASVEDIGRTTPADLGLYNDAQEAALTRLVADIRSYSSMPLGLQIGHAGRKASTRPEWGWKSLPLPVAEGGWQPASPSAIAFDEGWNLPLALDEAGLERVKQAFVTAAQRAHRCGFDLIEFHGAHGYLLSAFVSPLANFRTDAYGGSLENRMRFPLEVAAAVRAAWPAPKPLGMRINGHDWHERGATLDDAVIYARALKNVGLDYITTSAGNGAPGVKFPPIVPGYMVPFAERVRAEAGIPTMAVGFIVKPEHAEEIVASGKADMVAIARGLIDNPRWPWHAATALGHDLDYPDSYRGALPKKWLGYPIAHPGYVPPPRKRA